MKIFNLSMIVFTTISLTSTIPIIGMNNNNNVLNFINNLTNDPLIKELLIKSLPPTNHIRISPITTKKTISDNQYLNNANPSDHDGLIKKIEQLTLNNNNNIIYPHTIPNTPNIEYLNNNSKLLTSTIDAINNNIQITLIATSDTKNEIYKNIENSTDNNSVPKKLATFLNQLDDTDPNNTKSDDTLTDTLEYNKLLEYEKTLPKKMLSFDYDQGTFFFDPLAEVITYYAQTKHNQDLLELAANIQEQKYIVSDTLRNKVYRKSLDILEEGDNSTHRKLFVFLAILYCLSSPKQELKYYIYKQHLKKLVQEKYKPAQILTISLFNILIKSNIPFEDTLLHPIMKNYDILFKNKKTYPKYLLSTLDES